MLQALGIEVKGYSDTHYQCLCVFHNNFNTPAATVSKDSGMYWCWNADCGVRLKLVDVVKEMRRCDTFAAMRFIAKHEQEFSVLDKVKEKFATPGELPKFNEDLLRKMQESYWNSPEAQEYIASRGINEFSAKAFGLGFDKKRQMVVTPMFDTNDTCVGLIGRSIVQKQFKNSKDLPSSKTLFNISKAKKQSSDTLVVVESNYDCIRAHQAGFPNTVATLMGTFTDYHLTQVSRSFSRIIIAVDVDEPGEKLAQKIARKCRDRGLWTYRMQFSEFEILPHGAKDLSDCSEPEIIQTLKNAKSYTG